MKKKKKSLPSTIELSQRLNHEIISA